MFMAALTPARRLRRKPPFRRADLELTTATVPACTGPVSVGIAVREDVLTTGGVEGVPPLGGREYEIALGPARHVFTLVADIRDDDGEPVPLDALGDARVHAVRDFRINTIATGIGGSGDLATERVAYAERPAVLGLLTVECFAQETAEAARMPLWQTIEAAGEEAVADLARQWASRAADDRFPAPGAVWLLRTLHVRPELRGQHLGAMLIAHALTALPVRWDDAAVLVPCPLPDLFEAERKGGAEAPTRGPRAFATAVRGLRAYYGRLGFKVAAGCDMPGAMYLDMRLKHPLLDG